MRRGPKDYLKLGDWNATCDVCGFKFKASELRKRWDGAMVCHLDYEERHPQDLIRTIRDNPSVPWSRPPVEIHIGTSGLADGSILADGSVLADGTGVVVGTALHVTFGPVDPDSL